MFYLSQLQCVLRPSRRLGSGATIQSFQQSH